MLSAAAGRRIRPHRLQVWAALVRSPFMLRFRRHRAAQVGGWLLAFLFLIGISAPWIAPFDPDLVDMTARMAPPSWGHWFGTDQLGRDLLSRVIYGARISVFIGVVSVGISLVGGLPPGIMAGYYGGRVDQLMSALIDFLLSFPALLLAIFVIALFGPGLVNAMIAIGISQVPIFARLIRGEVLRVSHEPFVEAARALGAGHARIILVHILPSTLPPIVIQATLSLATAILAASYLGFLGMGAQPPLSEWGAMLNEGRRYLRVAAHISIFPGLSIMAAILAFNLFGDGVRDAMDPKSYRR